MLATGVEEEGDHYSGRTNECVFARVQVQVFLVSAQGWNVVAVADHLQLVARRMDAYTRYSFIPVHLFTCFVSQPILFQIIFILSYFFPLTIPILHHNVDLGYPPNRRQVRAKRITQPPQLSILPPRRVPWLSSQSTICLGYIYRRPLATVSRFSTRWPMDERA